MIPDPRPEYRVLFRFTPRPEDAGIDDLACEYIVYELDEIQTSGLMIYARYRTCWGGEWSEKWVANPWNSRLVIRELLRQLDEANYELDIVNHRDPKPAILTNTNSTARLPDG